ncbi:MAG: ribosome biogenesis GTPase Der [Patescibacteria group bacterium]|nr:ribosome biogenesis GTPase Der [Patescibacteria group bacterium]
MLAKKIKRDKPLVVVVGRTNVGKSTLFNALTDKKRALVSNIAGTTRDANIGQVDWNNKSFTLIDTGGFMDFEFLLNKKAVAETIDEKVQRQAREFITRADLILFLVDAKDGLMPEDRTMAASLKKILPNFDKVILAANKADSRKIRLETSVFFKLQCGEPFLISAATGSGTGDLLDLIMEKTANFKPVEEEPLLGLEEDIDTETIKVCILGKPNVGKSSLLNAILGYERVIVSNEEHTTREPQHTDLEYKGKAIRIIDTAGIHRQGLKRGPKKAHDELAKKLEHQGIASTLVTLGRADIVFLVVDIKEGLTKQDTKLAEEIIDRGKSLVIIANKWDLVDERDTQKYIKEIYSHIPFAQFVPVQFISAKTKEKVDKLLDWILEINKNRQTRISEEDLLEFIKYCVNKHKPTKGKGQYYPKIRHFEQRDINPPCFAVTVGAKEFLADSYLHFLANRLRDRYGLDGTPVKIWVEKGRIVHGKKD